jgi:hypothetical protein
MRNQHEKKLSIIILRHLVEYHSRKDNPGYPKSENNVVIPFIQEKPSEPPCRETDGREMFVI